jgi:cyclopropane fatty-acyl-phospholipid synthase-like methyltransferase
MAQPGEVAKYYNDWNERYRSVYGEVIQAYRSSNTTELLESILKSLSLKDGMRLIDAGCGFAAPSIFFASKCNVIIDAVTISSLQANEASAIVKEKGLEKRVLVKEVDYHNLADLFKAEFYDGVFFLESLGHTNNLNKVIEGVRTVLKPNGFIYIKDFFFKETNHPEFNRKVEAVVERVNKNYCYQVLSLIELLKTLRLQGFTIEFIRPPDFVHDITIRKKFEDDNGIDNYGALDEFYYAEWLEIKCIKSDY